MNKKLAITIGDPSGIGPEIILKTLSLLDCDPQKILLVGNRQVFALAEGFTGLKLNKEIEIVDIPCDLSGVKTGEISAESGKLAYLALEHACKMALNVEIGAIATAPLSKKAINIAGYEFSGQTEILEHFLGKDASGKAEMLFVSGNFRVLLLTRHIPLAEAAKNITAEKILSTLQTLNTSLKENFNIEKPKIAVCGLNPHAGEDGLLGDEELNVIIPALKRLKNEFGVDVQGPFPADTLFVSAGKSYVKSEKQKFDCYVACYHDQGLIPVKLCSFEKSVNTTIGLSVIRTSPAHGTAFDIAGKNIADPSSMTEAVKLAQETLK